MRLLARIPYAAVLLMVLISSCARTAGAGRFGGTFIAAIVCEEGIVIGADSRSTFLDGEGRPLGYVDGTPKIYSSATTAVAVSGLTSVDGEMFGAFVARNSFLLDRPANEVLFGFGAWLPFKNSTGVLLLSAGFDDRKPEICARSVVQPQECQSSGFIANKPSPSLRAWAMSLRGAPKAGDAMAALKRAIQESAAGDPTVGGPVNVVEIRAGAPAMQLESLPIDYGWKTVCELVRDHRSGRIHIIPTGAAADLDRYLNASCPR